MLKLKRIRLSTILNIIGLSVAFTAFMIIMIQVRYDLGFNKNIKNWEEVYRVEIVFSGKYPDVYNAYFSRHMLAPMFAATPGVEVYTTMNTRHKTTFHRENQEASTDLLFKDENPVKTIKNKNTESCNKILLLAS